MTSLLLTLATFAAAQNAGPVQRLSDVLPTVERAVATGDTVALADTFGQMAGGEVARPLGQFGLAVLDLFAYRYDQAGAGLGRLATEHAGARVGAWATYVLALGDVARGQLGDAIEHSSRAVQDARVLGDSTLEAQALVLLGPLMARNRGPAAARPYLLRADSVRSPTDGRTAARLLCIQALVLTQTNASAVPELIDRGMAAAADDDLRGRGTCAHAQAVAFVMTGDLMAADDAFEESQALFERAGDFVNLGAILQWKGWTEWNGANFVAAVPHLETAVRLAERTGNESVAGWAMTNLAQIAVTFNDHAQAAARLRAARDAFAHTGDTAGLRAVANVEATHLAAIGAYDAADSIFGELVQFADGNGIYAWSMGLRGSWTEMHIRQGDLSGAQLLLDEARAAIERGRLHAWSGPFDRLDAYLALRDGELEKAHRLLDRSESLLDRGQVGALYQINALRAHGSLISERPDEAYRRILTAADQLERERRSLSIDALRRFVFQGGGLARIGAASTATVIAGLATRGNVAGAYDIAERRRGRELLDRVALARTMNDGLADQPTGEPTPVSLDDVQRRLPDRRTALIQYATGPNRTPTTAFVITRDTAWAVQLPSHDSLRPAIEDFLVGIQGGQYSEGAARDLGRQVLDPVIGLLPAEVDRVLLVPDGALYRLPFAALRIDGDVYAIERFSLTYAPSGTVAVRRRDRSSSVGVRLLAVGDPDYERMDAWAVSFRAAYDEAGGLPRIRWSGREARRVARYADESDVLVRGEATEAAFKRMELSQYDVVHLATHALVDEGTVLRTSLAMAPGDGQDGFLDVAELTELGLGADLVVLSGCRTAGGQVVAGEGLLGLSGPLLSAGAGVVVGTQWAVEDRAVRSYVTRLYDRLAEGETVADALRMAQLEGLERGDPPRDWAVFAATGDPSITVALQRPPWWKFW